MTDEELEAIYNSAIDDAGRTVLDGLRAVAMAERDACISAIKALRARHLVDVPDCNSGSGWTCDFFAAWDAAINELLKRSNEITNQSSSDKKGN